MKHSYDCKRRRVALQVGRAVKGDDFGQALVELALVLPMLMLLMVGAAEFGRLAYAAVEVSNAAHAGAQYGAQSHLTAGDNAGMQQAALNDGSNVTAMTATSTHYCKCANGAASTCVSSDCTGSRMLVYVQVNTKANVDTVFYYPGIAKLFTLRGQAIMTVEQ